MGLIAFCMLQRPVLVARSEMQWAHAGKDAFPAIVWSIAVLYRLALECLWLEMEASTCVWSGLYACCSAATLRMFFKCWYTLLAPSAEGAGRVSKSVAATATFWLAMGKVVCGVPLGLMVMATALTWAQAWCTRWQQLSPSPAWPCICAVRSSGRRGLLAHQLAHHGVEAPIARHQSTRHGLMLVAPPSRLVAGLEGAPFMATALPSVL
jgi:hypothetical protein